MGYLFSPENWSSSLTQIDLDHLTSINLAFIHPDESGKFAVSEDLTNAIAHLKAANKEVFFSCYFRKTGAILSPKSNYSW
jgi:hypothetical protein